MSGSENIRKGMRVVGEDNQALGTVESVQANAFHVGGRRYTGDMVARVAQDTVYLRGVGTAGAGAGATTEMTDKELRVPVVEERLNVGKREAELGEVQIRKTVTEEERTVPVTLHRDEVTVQERDVADRPLRAGEEAFKEETIRVPVRGEEAVVAKEAVVTGEVVIDKTRVAEERQITETVRKQRVEVDERYRRARTDLEREHTTRASKGRAFAAAEPNYKAGFTAAHDERYSGQEFEQAEPTLREAHGAGGDRWEQLREEVRAGWNKGRTR